MAGSSSHGAVAFFKRGVLPRGKRNLAAAIDSIIQGIRVDLGGDLTGTQEVMLGQLRKALLFQTLIDTWLSAPGRTFIDKGGNLPSCLNNFYLANQNTAIRLCRDLGLKRINPIESLEGYLKAKASACPVIEMEGGKPKDTGAAEKAPQRASCEGSEA